MPFDVLATPTCHHIGLRLSSAPSFCAAWGVHFAAGGTGPVSLMIPQDQTLVWKDLYLPLLRSGPADGGETRGR